MQSKSTVINFISQQCSEMTRSVRHWECLCSHLGSWMTLYTYIFRTGCSRESPLSQNKRYLYLYVYLVSGLVIICLDVLDYVFSLLVPKSIRCETLGSSRVCAAVGWDELGFFSFFIDCVLIFKQIDWDTNILMSTLYWHYHFNDITTLLTLPLYWHYHCTCGLGDFFDIFTNSESIDRFWQNTHLF